MIRALLLVDSLSQADDVQRCVAAQRDSETKFIYPNVIGHEKASFGSLLKDCSEVIKEEDIDIVVCMHPENHLIHTALIQKFKHMRGPSFESALLCLHKFYCRKVLLSGFTLNFECIEVEDAKREDYETALDDVGDAALLSDAIGCTGSMLRQAKLEQMTTKEIGDIRALIKKNHNRFIPIMTKYIGKEKHPLTFEPMILVSENWKNYSGDVTFHQVECCIADGEVVPWVITDVVMTSDRRRCVKYVSIPSSLKETSVHEIWGTVGILSQRLIGFGFADQFFNLLLLCTRDGGIKIVNLDCGIIVSNGPLYRHVYQHGDNLKACVQVLRGQMIREPKLNPKRHSIRAELRTFNDGHIDDVIDVKTVRQVHDAEWFTTNFEQEIKHDAVDGGMHLGNLYVNGTDIDDCLNQTYDKLKSVLKPKSKTNWKRGVSTEALAKPPKSGKAREKTIL